jgi:AraC family transcriptional regulator, positive regulator of tynA and feaB
MEHLREPWTHWSSANEPPRLQFDAWYAALNESHLEWALHHPSTPEYRAELNQRRIGGLRIVQCSCDPCSGMRTRREIARSSDGYFGVLIIRRGDEVVRCGDTEAILHAGDLVVWDSTQPMEFRFRSPLNKVTLLLPQHYLRTRIPGIEAYIGNVIDARAGLGAITAAHISMLARHATEIGDANSPPIVDATLELLAACLQARDARPLTPARKALLATVKNYIERHLDDPLLSPQTIAAACGISLRYLHLLFADEEISVSRWIISRRLEQCRRDLVQVGAGQQIAATAMRWGFTDAAHFSRAFRQQFGMSPRAYRQQYALVYEE